MAPPPASQAHDGRRAAAALASKSQELKTLEAQECSFAPKVQLEARGPNADEAVSGWGLREGWIDRFVYADEDAAVVTAAEAEAALLHPTESQESSIQLHLVRQERAREQTLEAQHNAKEEAWESERVTLVSIIDAQRRELALREQAQQDAVRVAERFAAATQAFEERLVVVEQSAAKELEEVKRLLASQAAATDLILSSLGISRRPNAGDGSTRYD
ncbi:hypothetical protein BBJ28_00012590 [Nothophytophthora sp. Chile5]|nr:hypothetical protein BBJ28_00012590 [Nothophytophthora sp. Chile5]